MDELVSVIVPVYNVEQWLDRCVESIVNQTYKKIEIILVDDGSPDECPSMCDKWAERDSRIKSYHKKNGGLSDARNFGIKRATGEYVVFIDSDDQVYEKYVEVLLGLALDNEAQIGICNPVHCFKETDVMYSDTQNTIVYIPEEAITIMLYQKNFLVSACAKIFKKELFDGIEFPVGMWFEDSAIMYLLFERASRIAFGDGKIYAYFHRKGSITTESFSIKQFDIVDISKKIFDYYKNNLLVEKAARSYLVVACLRIYMNCPKDYYVDKRNDAVKILKEEGLKVLTDRKARRKTRVGLFLFFFARPIMPKIYKKVRRWV